MYRMSRRPVSFQLLLAPNLLLSLTELVAEQRRWLRGKDNTPEQKSGFRRVTALSVRDFGNWTDQFLSCLIERGFDPVLFVDTIAFELIAAISLFRFAPNPEINSSRHLLLTLCLHLKSLHSIYSSRLQDVAWIWKNGLHWSARPILPVFPYPGDILQSRTVHF